MKPFASSSSTWRRRLDGAILYFLAAVWGKMNLRFPALSIIPQRCKQFKSFLFIYLDKLQTSAPGHITDARVAIIDLLVFPSTSAVQIRILKGGT